MINIDRLWNRIERLAQIGKTDKGGITRLSYTREESEANELVKRFMEEAGLNVYYDPVGNLIGTRSGTEELPAIMLGSHIDTVPEGGKFDGSLGVLTAIEAVQSLREHNIDCRHPILVVSFKDEEGSRFGFGMIGSRAIAGTLTPADLEHKDKQGITIREAMLQSGFEPDRFGEAKINNIKAYLELHIEQGKVLESYNVAVGNVTGIAGPLWLKFKIHGEAEHAGATPMGQRKDALAAASLMISKIEKITEQYQHAVATVGSLYLEPGGINVIPGYAEFTVDIRDIHENIRNQLEQEIKEYSLQVAEERDVELEIEELQRVAPLSCSDVIQEAIKESIEESGGQIISLPSGAGHDAMQFRQISTGMIFVRSQDGISHNPKEYTSKDDVKQGAEVMVKTLLKLDQT
ncbi:Zn-dependent hydrolase [Paenactinomyces guangxiensis]|uniref:Zn-dependent hydrolase n=1 Tax=Paenactinomyces guangxiensis TaxID=1490290 RepID=A0A7W1WSF5_9BACL|nr:Zn-dependent hydrolase [Paenactinomyces guangxiensis]MBA4494981.1 Zn-dependent hydrolase [Paenactinomyces guangxiensis]MBH8592064.1 Zn-dependent hydrolase [Paenactinomyces guangxiensis]